MVLTDVEVLNTSKPPPCGNHAEKKVDDEEEEVEDEYSDDYTDYDDDDDEEEDKCGLGCPFCSEDFDVLGLCCHIDLTHYKEVKAAICPVCFTEVDVGMTVHLITKHESVLKILCKKTRNGGSHAALILKKESVDESLFPISQKYIFKGASSKGSSPVKSFTAAESDALFLPFCYCPPLSLKLETAHLSNEASLTRNSSEECDSESLDIEMLSIVNKNEAKVQKCDFVKEILFSMILNDNL